MTTVKLLSVPKGKNLGRELIEVISLDGDDDDATDIIEEEDVDDNASDHSETINSSENDADVMEVISLDDEEEEDEDDDDESSCDENDCTPIGSAKLAFLDPENRKIHKFIKIVNAEDEDHLVDIEEMSSDSDVEEVTDKELDKHIYITIDPDDYKKVMKERPIVQDNKKVKRKNKSINNQGVKRSRPNPSSSGEINFKVFEAIDRSINTTREVKSYETSDSLKGPDIPKLICCQKCSFACKKEADMMVHHSVKHPSKSETLRTYTAAEILELEREMKDQADDCNSCGQALWYLPTLRAHAIIHSTGKVGCEACRHGTAVIKLLMDHLESHVGSEEEEDSDV